MVIGLGTRFHVCMNSKFENGVFHNQKAMKTLSGGEAERAGKSILFEVSASTLSEWKKKHLIPPTFVGIDKDKQVHWALKYRICGKVCGSIAYIEHNIYWEWPLH